MQVRILILIGVFALTTQNVEARQTDQPTHKTVIGLALPEACDESFDAIQTGICKAGNSRNIASKGKNSRNKGRISRNIQEQEMPIFDEPISLAIAPIQQTNPKPNYDFATAHCMVICT
jgi:hypothetical protein